MADFAPLMISMSLIVNYQLSDIGHGTPAGQATSLLISVGMSLRSSVLPQETVDDLMLLAREFGHKSLIASLVPQRNAPRH
jgi:hypothetical protein